MVINKKIFILFLISLFLINMVYASEVNTLCSQLSNLKLTSAELNLNANTIDVVIDNANEQTIYGFLFRIHSTKIYTVDFATGIGAFGVGKYSIPIPSEITDVNTGVTIGAMAHVQASDGKLHTCTNEVTPIPITTKETYCSLTTRCVSGDKCCPTACYYPDDIDCPTTKLDPNSQKSITVQQTSSLNCDGVDIQIKSICYDKISNQINFKLSNTGPLDPRELAIISIMGDGSSGGLYLKNEKTEDNYNLFLSFYDQAETSFSIGGMLDYAPSTVTANRINVGNFLKSLSIIPISPTNPGLKIYSDPTRLECIDKEVFIKEITDCKTGEQIWSYQSIEQTPPINNNISQQTSSTNGNYFNYLIILGILFVGGFYFIKYKVYKKLKIPKKEIKKEKIEIQEVKKEEIIPQSITTAISVSNFTVNYGSKSILNNVNFKIDRGKFVSIIGGSGTGKSTIIESLVGRKKPNSGKILIFNKELKELLQHVGFVPQNVELYLNQTVLQNLKSSATKYGINVSDSEIDKTLNKINLANRKDIKASNLSGGQKKLLSLGMELIKNPELLILDEPTTGLDPNSRNQIITALSHLVNYNKKTILITTHFMDDCEECDEIIIVHDKGIVAQDSPQKLERRLPGSGKVVNIILDNVTDDLLKKIKKIQGIENIIREGRSLKILTNEPSAVKLSQKIDEVGGSILESKIINATMKEVFVYYTGEELKDV